MTRFPRNSQPAECPTHGRTMMLVPMPAPSWMQLTARDLERQVYRCTQPNCPRVATVDAAHDPKFVFSRQSLVI